MKLHRCSSLLIIVILLFPQAFAIADDYEEFLELDLESLMNIEVVTASRRVQKISEAPNAMYVITAEDIKRSGAVDLADLFRMVPGVDVVNVHGNTYGVSARGLSERFSQRMLVMIDGRSIYTTFFGGVFWENDQIFLEDIKQIEVIRGPGATMWGANALNGVINIITKDPEEDQGFLVTGRAGTKRYRENVTRYSDSFSDRLSFSLTAGYREDEGTRGVNDYRRVPKITGRVKYKFTENTNLHFFAGVNQSEVGFDLSLYTPSMDVRVRSNYQVLRLEHQLSETSQLQFQLYHDYFEVHSDKTFFIDDRNINIEIQHSFALGKRHRFIWGGNYRTTEDTSNFLYPETDHNDLMGFFLQDELKILDNLTFIFGIKYEENSFTGGDWSPRGCLLYTPRPGHHFRFALSRAYRTPSFASDRMRVVQTLPAPLPPVPLGVALGNHRLDPEEMTAYELGYRTTLFKKIGLNVELYYNEIDRLSEIVITRLTWPLQARWDNYANIIAKGIEVAVDFPLTNWWTLKANYTFQDVENKRANKNIDGVPKHKFTLWSSFTFKNGFSLDVITHYVDKTKWKELPGEVKIGDYLRLDIRIAQKLFNDKVELSLTGQNLTDKLHPENSDIVGTYEIERLIYGQISLHF